MSFANTHQTWQQRVLKEERQVTRSIERFVTSGLLPEQTLSKTYTSFFQNQLRKNTHQALGSASKRPIQSNKATYCYGGKSKAVESSDTVPLDETLPGFQDKLEMLQQNVYQRTFRAVSGQSESRIRKPPAARVHYPKSYFNYVGYEKSEASTVQRDTLGQRVRERFNEEVSYDNLSQASGKLTLKPSLVGGTSIKSRFSQNKSKRALSKTTKKSLTSTVINRVIGVKQLQPSVESIEHPILIESNEVAEIVSEQDQQQLYIQSLTEQLKTEVDKRTQLELELLEIKKLNEEIAMQLEQ